MKTKLKRALSVLLTVAMICSMLVIPASAATDKVTLSLGNGTWNAANYYVVDIVATGNDGDFGMYSGEVYVSFDTNVLNLALVD